MTAVRAQHAATVRAVIASSWLGSEITDAQLGDVVLRDHQRDAATRLRAALARHGGALLADEVGLGKTYTALAAARDARSLLVVSPAALAPMWRSALELTHLRADHVSLESLSHREPTAAEHDVVIVDEAHHARNPATHRYQRLASLARHARVLLLSATPIHNTAGDLHALLAIFLGSRAERMSPSDLGACIVRRTRGDVASAGTPNRTRPQWLEVPSPPAVLDALVAIPPPCPPRDGADGGALVTLSLVRIWASTDAALRVALRNRLARAESLADALVRGRHPTRFELRAWVVGDDATQLAFPELVTPDVHVEESGELLDAVRRHAEGVRRALSVLAQSDVIDDHRSQLIRDIQRRHANESVVVFSQFAESVHAMFARLRRYGRVACITARGASVAGGDLTRAEALARFAPRAHRVAPPSRAEEIALLIATDLLSEGINLQDASVVVHLDLPWTSARLTQRLGRVWRIGSAHECVREYALTPPAPAEAVLRSLDVLRRKAGAAWAGIGDAFAALLAERIDSDVAMSTAVSGDAASAMESLRRTLLAWHPPPRDELALPARAPETVRGSSGAGTMVGGTRAPFCGWIAAVRSGAGIELVATRDDGTPTSDPRRVSEIALAASGDACAVAPARIARALRELERYLAERRGSDDARLDIVGSRPHARVAGRIAAVAAAAPTHRRVVVSRLAAQARSVVDRTRAAGGERALAALASAPLGIDASGTGAEAWLDRVIELGAGAGPNDGDEAEDSAASMDVRALLVLVSRGT